MKSINHIKDTNKWENQNVCICVCASLSVCAYACIYIHVIIKENSV